METRSGDNKILRAVQLSGRGAGKKDLTADLRGDAVRQRSGNDIGTWRYSRPWCLQYPTNTAGCVWEGEGHKQIRFASSVPQATVMEPVRTLGCTVAIPRQNRSPTVRNASHPVSAMAAQSKREDQFLEEAGFLSLRACLSARSKG